MSDARPVRYPKISGPLLGVVYTLTALCCCWLKSSSGALSYGIDYTIMYKLLLVSLRVPHHVLFQQVDVVYGNTAAAAKKRFEGGRNLTVVEAVIFFSITK